VGGATATTAQLRLLAGFDPSIRPLGLQFRPLRLTAADQIPARMRITNSERRPDSPDGPILTLAYLPAGTYRVASGSLLAADGTAEVMLGPALAPTERWRFDPSRRDADYRLELAVGVEGIVVNGDPRATQTIRRMALQPIAIVPPERLLSAEPAVRAVRLGKCVLYGFEQDKSTLEGDGAWMFGEVDAPLAVAVDAPATSARLVVRNVPVDNHVKLWAAGWKAEFALGPGEERVVEVPVAVDPATGIRGVLLHVHADRGFRPADVDPASQEQRYLGVWVTTARPELQNLATPMM
jgi:hypothetical protein